MAVNAYCYYCNDTTPHSSSGICLNCASRQDKQEDDYFSSLTLEQKIGYLYNRLKQLEQQRKDVKL